MKILFITSTRIGDAVLSTGIIEYLRQKHPSAQFTVVCGPAAAPLFEALPNMERLISMTKEKMSGHWFRLWWECVPYYWDMVIDLRRSAVSYLLAAGGRFPLKSKREPVHRVRQIADILSLPEAPMPKIWISDKHRQRATEFIPGDGLVLGIGPTTNWRAKTWRAENFVALVNKITQAGEMMEGARIAIFGAPDERELAQPVIDALPNCIDLVGKLDLLTAYACLKRCSFYIGNDSALMHLAAASGIPTLGLFGPSLDSHYAPWGWNTKVVRTIHSYDDIFPPNFDHRSSDSLMDSLSVDSAYDAANELWGHIHVG